jgi:hypothetical protein
MKVCEQIKEIEQEKKKEKWRKEAEKAHGPVHGREEIKFFDGNVVFLLFPLCLIIVSEVRFKFVSKYIYPFAGRELEKRYVRHIFKVNKIAINVLDALSIELYECGCEN